MEAGLYAPLAMLHIFKALTSCARSSMSVCALSGIPSRLARHPTLPTVMRPCIMGWHIGADIRLFVPGRLMHYYC